jgi:P27 family predicted phage terminase small subunit
MKKIIKESTPVKPEPPVCPDWLNDAAKAEWSRIVAKLESFHILSQYDVAELAAYCQAYGRWTECENVLKDSLTTEYTNKAGASNLVPKPEAKLAISYMKQINTFWDGVNKAAEIKKRSEHDPFSRL